MDIRQCGSLATRRGPGEWFTGTVWLDPVIEAEAPARLRASLVRFEPGARTNWHTHPLGQTLHVVSGSGLAQTKGGPIRAIRAGDTIWIPPGEVHWHGASAGTAMTHMAMQEALDGRAVEWLDPVTDQEFSATT